MSVSEILSPEVLDAIKRPTKDAVCLPSSVYTSADFLEAERQKIFFAGWAFAAAGAEIAQPGDALPITLAGLPLLLVRSGDGALKAFHNVCRHRGVQLVPGKQTGRSVLACRYHGWTYALDGALVRTPHFSGPNMHETPGIDRSCMGLQEVRCETWSDLVFVDLSGTAPPLARHLAPLARRWAHYDLARLRHDGSCTFDIAANWKLAIENFLESYHLPFAHPTLNAASKMQAHYSMLEELYLGQGSRQYDPTKAGHAGLPSFPGLTAAQSKTAEYPTLLPNLMLGIHADYLFVFGVDPIAPDRTRETFHFYYVGEEALAEKLKPVRDTIAAFWRTTNLEDIGVVEGMQIGRRSPGYRDGRFSPYHEATTHEFQRRVANAVAGYRGEAAIRTAAPLAAMGD
jgi:choline monooxygenase